MSKAALILAYYSIKDPLCQSTVIEYLYRYKEEMKGYKLVLLTFENYRFPISKDEIEQISLELAAQGIDWHRLTWRSGGLKPVKKLLDLWDTSRIIGRIAKIHDLELIYSEGFPGAILGYLASKKYGLKHLIHSFEPHAAYMLEGGTWTKWSWEYRLLRYFEKKVALHSSGILTATQGMIDRLKSWGVAPVNLHKVPSCINTDQFNFDPQSRRRIRANLGFGAKDQVLVYVGKFGGMYWEQEFYRFAKIYCTSNRKLLIITTEQSAVVESGLRAAGVPDENYFITKLPHEQIPAYLSASDIGLVAVRQWPSKQYCSPIKTGEYLACGLPVIIPDGISDDYQQLSALGVGLSLTSLSDADFRKAVEELPQFYPLTASIREQARNYAIQYRGFDRYRSTYAQLFANPKLTGIRDNQ